MAILAQYSFPSNEINEYGTAYNPTTINPDVSAGPVNDNSGVGKISFQTNSSFSYTTNPILQVWTGVVATSQTNAILSGTYFEFTVQRTGTKVLNLTSLTYKIAKGGSGTRGSVVRTSVDNYASNVYAADTATTRPTWTTANISLSAASFQNLTSITFRIYIYAGNNGQSQELDDITLNGFADDGSGNITIISDQTSYGYGYLGTSKIMSDPPLLFLTQTRKTELQSLVTQNGSFFKGVYDQLKARADTNNVVTGYEYNSADSLHTQLRSYFYCSMAIEQSFCYMMTGNTAYATSAYNALRYTFDNPDTNNNSCTNTGQGLGMAALCRAFAIVYSWAYHGMNQTQRDWVYGQLEAGANAWPNFSHTNTSSTHKHSNWNGVTRGAEIVTIYAIGDHLNRASRLSTTRTNLLTHFQSFGDNGLSQEGIGYLTYGEHHAFLAAILDNDIGGNSTLLTEARNKNFHKAVMYAFAFANGFFWPTSAPQETRNYQITNGVDSGGYEPNGMASMVFRIMPTSDIGYYRYFYDRFIGTQSTHPNVKFERGGFLSASSGNAFSLCFYNDSVAAVDPTNVYSQSLADTTQGQIYHRNRWQDDDDTLVSLGSDVRFYNSSWNEEDAGRLQLISHGVKWFGEPVKDGRSALFNCFLVNDSHAINSSDTGTHIHSSSSGNKNYGLIGGGIKYTNLGVLTYERHLFSDFNASGYSIISVLDKVTAGSSKKYTFNIKVGTGEVEAGNFGITVTSGTELGKPYFLMSKGTAFVKAYFISVDNAANYTWSYPEISATSATNYGNSIQLSTSATNLNLWTVMVAGKGTPPSVSVSGDSLSATMLIGNERLLSYNSTDNRIESNSTSQGVSASIPVNSGTFSQPSLTVATGVTIPIGVNSGTFSQPSLTVATVRSVSVSVLVNNATFSQPNITVVASQNRSVSIPVNSGTFSQPSLTVATTTSINYQFPVNSGVFSQPNITVVASQNRSVSIPVNSGTFSQPNLTVATVRSVSASIPVNNGTFSQPNLTVSNSTNLNINIPVNSGTFSQPNLTVATVRSISASIPVNNGIFSIPTMTVLPVINVNVNIPVNSGVVSINSVSISTGSGTIISIPVNVGIFTVNNGLDKDINIPLNPIESNFISNSVVASNQGNAGPNILSQIGLFSTPTITISAQRNISVSIGINALIGTIPSFTIIGSSVANIPVNNGTFSQPNITVVASQNRSVSIPVNSGTFSQPSLTVAGSSVANIPVNSGVFSQPTLSLSISKSISFSVLTGMFTIPSFGVGSQGNVGVSIPVNSGTFSQPNLTVATVRSVSASIPVNNGTFNNNLEIIIFGVSNVSFPVISGIFSTPSQNISGNSIVNISLLQGNFNIPSISTQVGISVNVNIPTQTLVGNVLSPSISSVFNHTVNVPTISHNFEILGVGLSVGGSRLVSVDVIEGNFNIPTITPSTTVNNSISIPTVGGLFSILSPILGISVGILFPVNVISGNILPLGNSASVSYSMPVIQLASIINGINILGNANVSVQSSNSNISVQNIIPGAGVGISLNILSGIFSTPSNVVNFGTTIDVPSINSNISIPTLYASIPKNVNISVISGNINTNTITAYSGVTINIATLIGTFTIANLFSTSAAEKQQRLFILRQIMGY